MESHDCCSYNRLGTTCYNNPSTGLHPPFLHSIPPFLTHIDAVISRRPDVHGEEGLAVEGLLDVIPGHRSEASRKRGGEGGGARKEFTGDRPRGGGRSGVRWQGGIHQHVEWGRSPESIGLGWGRGSPEGIGERQHLVDSGVAPLAHVCWLRNPHHQLRDGSVEWRPFPRHRRKWEGRQDAASKEARTGCTEVGCVRGRSQSGLTPKRFV